MALDKRAWRCQKGHGALEKGHGAAPCYFALDLTLSQCIDYWKWLMSHNCFPFTPIIMKFQTKTPYELRMCPIDFQVKRSNVKVTMHHYWKWLLSHNCFPFTPIFMKLHTKTPMNWGCALWIWGQKVKVPIHWMIDYWKYRIIAFP